METATATTAGLSGQVLFYDRPEPLNSDSHGKLALVRTDKPYDFASTGHVLPVTVTEFGPAAISYPIIFAGDKHQPVVVTGLNGGDSLFVNADGSYQIGAYIPAYIRRYPFVLANDESAQRMIVCIDRTSKLLSETGDVPLFDAAGQPTQYTQNAIKFCDDFEVERRRTETFIKLLEDLDIFELKDAKFTPVNPDGSNGEPQKIAEYFAVSEEKLLAIPADKLVELRDSGALQQIYAHLLSLANWDRLIAMTISRDAAAAPSA